MINLQKPANQNNHLIRSIILKMKKSAKLKKTNLKKRLLISALKRK